MRLRRSQRRDRAEEGRPGRQGNSRLRGAAQRRLRASPAMPIRRRGLRRHHRPARVLQLRPEPPHGQGSRQGCGHRLGCDETRPPGSVNKSVAIVAVVVASSSAQFGCGSDDEAATKEAKLTATGRISSSIPDGAQLSDPLRWTARVTGVPPSEVVSVRFLIDGKVAHVDKEAPYEFAGRRENLLVPGSLGHGSHTLAVDARLRGGRRLTGASTATVSTHGEEP